MPSCDAPRPPVPLALVLAACASWLAATDASADLIVVDGTTCNLMDAVTAANDDMAAGGCTEGNGADTLRVDADVTLTAVAAGSSMLAGSQAGTPDVSTDITIVAGSSAIVQRDPSLPSCASTPFRLFQVVSGGTLRLEGLTLRNGCGGHGGAIYTENGGPLEVVGCRFEGNTATGSGGVAAGGALRTTDTLQVHDSIFDSNLAGGAEGILGFAGRGGAIAMDGTSKVVTNSIFQFNAAVGGSPELAGDGNHAQGGAVYSDGKDIGSANGIVVHSYFLDNAAEGGDGVSGGAGGMARGGALALLDRIDVFGSTLEDNGAVGGDGDAAPAGDAFGGGVFTFAASRLGNLTVSGNLAGGGDSTSGGSAFGGGWHHGGGSASAAFLTVTANLARAGAAGGFGSGGVDVAALATVDNSVLAGNATRDSSGSDGVGDCAASGALVSAGYNLVQTPADCTFAATGDVTGLDPLLFDLLDRRCLTHLPSGRCLPTHAVDTTSPALDAGSCTVAGLVTDGRGASRPWDDDGIPNGTGDGCDPGAFEYIDQDEDGFEFAIDCDDLDATNACLVFLDGFESGDTTQWSATVGGV